MRVAVFSDIHGNPYACRAVLEAIAKEGELDAVVAAGDLCLGGSDPSACIAMLRAAGVVSVYGNTELYLLHPEAPPGDELHRNMWGLLKPVVQWVRSEISDDQFAWLEALPFDRRYSPSGVRLDDLLVVHANPKDVDLMIYPSPKHQKSLWGQIRQPDDDPDLVDVLEHATTGVLAFGHFHTTFRRRWRGLMLVDVACCSLPGVDHDPRARYTLFQWQHQGWEIEHRWVEYDHIQEIRALQASDMPNKENFLKYF